MNEDRTFTTQNVIDLVTSIGSVQDAETRWKAPADQLYARAYRIACVLATKESWQNRTVSPVWIFQLLNKTSTADAPQGEE